MPKEKKPRKPVLEKTSSAKQVAAKPAAEATPLDTAATELATKVTAKTKSRAKTKSQKINPPINPQTNLEEAIRFRAYEIYLQRGGMPGNPREDWAVAEREVRAYFDQNADA